MLGVVGSCGKAAAPAPAEKSQAVQGANTPGAPKLPSADFSGVLRGLVKLAPGATLPMAPPPERPPVNPGGSCRPYAEDDRRVVSQFEGTGGLTPIHLAVTQMKAVPEHKPETHDLHIRNCRLTPAVVGAMVGDELRIVNESDQPFMPVFPGDPFMRGLLKGESRNIKLERFGPAKVSCGFAGYCGESTVITVAHPLYAVTNERGEFEIKGIPLDQDVMVHAGHMLFEVSTLKLRLTKAQPEQTLEFVLTPLPATAKPFQVKEADRPAKPEADDAKATKGKAAKKPSEPPPSVIK
jgi:hypothetical protein